MDKLFSEVSRPSHETGPFVTAPIGARQHVLPALRFVRRELSDLASLSTGCSNALSWAPVCSFAFVTARVKLRS